MSRLTVEYQGLKVGALEEALGGVAFEYDKAFIGSGHQLSPFALPLKSGVQFRESPPSMRLPGLFEDSLPDQWGSRLMTEWFRRHGTAEHAITPLMRLAYVGRRAMGALVFTPERDSNAAPRRIALDDLYPAAAAAESGGKIDMESLVPVGSSVGGARPKALLALSKSDPKNLLPGAGEIPEGFEAWIVKFDTSKNGDWAPMEEAFACMARAAGIEMLSTRLLETSHDGVVRRHFAAKRFDREGSRRIHHHTLAGLLQAGGSDLDYTDLLRVTRMLTKDEREVVRAYRRAVFNVLAGNRDDHGKNHGFLYDDHCWRFGPAYDLTFGGNIQERGMAVVGERKNAGIKQLLELAESESLDKHQALTVINEVAESTSRWAKFAEIAGVSATKTAEIEKELRLLRASGGPAALLRNSD
ncbi:MAG: type II toxin-antitoxin system HipA family toxin [Opitutaceae bacterium]